QIPKAVVRNSLRIFIQLWSFEYRAERRHDLGQLLVLIFGNGEHVRSAAQPKWHQEVADEVTVVRQFRSAAPRDLIKHLLQRHDRLLMIWPDQMTSDDMVMFTRLPREPRRQKFRC